MVNKKTIDFHYLRYHSLRFTSHINIYHILMSLHKIPKKFFLIFCVFTKFYNSAGYESWSSGVSN